LWTLPSSARGINFTALTPVNFHGTDGRQPSACATGWHRSDAARGPKAHDKGKKKNPFIPSDLLTVVFDAHVGGVFCTGGQQLGVICADAQGRGVISCIRFFGDKLFHSIKHQEENDENTFAIDAGSVGNRPSHASPRPTAKYG
jgi:hypothetical protein